ncbi:hypothetical protein [Streptomyces sp. IBSBF 2806]|uniref:hypothetical protein n=1 Tax=Streptomyces sp. IBSBF 2806 TaxID=2903529 RepID=UPI002FDC718B
MSDNMRQPVTASAARHAERLRARDEQRATRTSSQTGGRQTSEIYGERAAAGFRADEALRERARLNELRARGMSVPGADEDVDEDDEEQQAEETTDPTDNPERRAARVAHRSVALHAHQTAMRQGRGFIA